MADTVELLKQLTPSMARFNGVAKKIVAVILQNHKDSTEAMIMTVCHFLHESKQDGKSGASQGLSFGNKLLAFHKQVQTALLVRVEMTYVNR
jgi:hypothetical protein